MTEPGNPIRGLDDERRQRFLAYLDRLSVDDRPVFGFPARTRSRWQWVGGGPTYVLVLLFPHHVVVSSRRGSSGSEKARRTSLLAEIASIAVTPGPLRAKVLIRFVDGERLRLTGVDRAAGEVLARFGDLGPAAFDRTVLGRGAFAPFFVACSRLLPLPDGLFTDTE